MEYSLGTWQDVKKQAMKHPRCPFCVLIQFFIDNSPVGYLYETGPASIEWLDRGGFFFDTYGSNLVFLNEDTATSPYGSGRLVKDTVNPALVRKWISLCEEHHGNKCTPKKDVIKTVENPRGVKILRLIDTLDQCIVEARPGDQYLALSYVWGPVMPLIRLQQDTIGMLTQKGEFKDNRDKIPVTIRDAMDLVQMIGQRYLWVDSLCLIQDNNDDMMDGISHMDLVYQCSLCTIIADYGSDSNAGLPGIHPNSRNVYQEVVEVLPGIRMTAKSGILEGLLTSSFDISILCWDNFPHTIKRPVRQENFPSWSWAGLKGIKDGYARSSGRDPDSTNSWLKTKTYIVWFKRCPNSANLELIWDLASQEAHGVPGEHTIAYRPTPNDPYGCIKPSFLDGLQTQPTLDDPRREEIIKSELDKRNYHLLHFFAFTVMVETLKKLRAGSQQELTMVYSLKGYRGKECGGVKLDNPRMMQKVKGPHELILLSSMDKYEGYFNDKIKHKRPFFWAMLISWIGDDKVVAERRGIGFIYNDCLDDVILPPGRVWKEIVLA
ncbi:hypothetical protein JR316_0011169 [Psilocybe cubensis]|uniref:Uncharacterized protein n=1 Tax=Psilocybe cubensis TaxID=181762 RepID=A0ACB8GNC3_PSICU|nr:hypothetical protein JR316_0011169 [Psilocybe cubensis]KAH9477250.1 hypothetical protein JR316_0011169 [Psilocybe cubensis]